MGNNLPLFLSSLDHFTQWIGLDDLGRKRHLLHHLLSALLALNIRLLH